MSKIAIIQGSSRSNGDTRFVAEQLASQINASVYDLNKYKISQFDYDHKNVHDVFIPLMEKLIGNYDHFIFATPVYWYTMSGYMKVFFEIAGTVGRFVQKTAF